MNLKILVIAVLLAVPALAGAQTIRFQADDWVAECGAAPEADCSIIGVFRSTNSTAPSGSFSLLADLRNRMVAIVGKPSPSRATIRVDKNPGFECTGDRYCVFAGTDSESILHQLKAGSLVLVDVVSGNHVFRASISTSGYRADLNKIRAQGFANLPD